MKKYKFDYQWKCTKCGFKKQVALLAVWFVSNVMRDEMTREFEMLKHQKTDLVKENIKLKNRIIDLESELEILKQEGYK